MRNEFLASHNVHKFPSVATQAQEQKPAQSFLCFGTDSNPSLRAQDNRYCPTEDRRLGASSCERLAMRRDRERLNRSPRARRVRQNEARAVEDTVGRIQRQLGSMKEELIRVQIGVTQRQRMG